MPGSETLARVAIVTGASRGLGRAVAHDLASLGFRVLTASTGATAPGVGERAHVPTDVTDPASVDRLVTTALRETGRVDVVVNNAGFANPAAALADTPDEVVRRNFAVNALGPFYLLRRVLPAMIASPAGGTIVNIASRAGVTPIPQLAAYSASKSALVSLTLALAKERPDGKLFAVSVCPGGMNTEMRATVYGASDARAQLDPQQVADVVVELADRRTVAGRAVPSGAAILISRESGTRVLEWALDERGLAGFGPERRANR